MDGLLLRVAALPQDLPQIHKIRYLVFQIEQGVDPTLEFDGNDRQAEHILAYFNDKPVGSARMRFLNATTVKVERVAILEEFRGRGFGRKLMEFLLASLAERQMAERQSTALQSTTLQWTQQPIEVVMNAQEAVRSFYEKLGFTAIGEPFEEAGIPHIRMKKIVRSPG
jgi:predicted GNAT family N-acyltransferase